MEASTPKNEVAFMVSLITLKALATATPSDRGVATILWLIKRPLTYRYHCLN